MSICSLACYVSLHQTTEHNAPLAASLAAAVAGGTAGPQAMLLHIAKPFQYLSVPCGLDWDPSASNAACVPDPSAAGLTAAAGGTCSAFKAAQVHNEQFALPLCVVMSNISQLALGIFAPGEWHN